MASQNNFKGKYQEGTFASGQGPVNGLRVVSESETKSQLEPAGPTRTISAQGGNPGDKLADYPKGSNFDPYGKSYMPEAYASLRPKNMGETPNYSVNEK